jgi:predicted GIY-YIG superfamily endonuclease
MNLSRNWKNMLFESFSTPFNAASSEYTPLRSFLALRGAAIIQWKIAATSCEAALKSVKKSFKNQIFQIPG